MVMVIKLSGSSSGTAAVDIDSHYLVFDSTNGSASVDFGKPISGCYPADYEIYHKSSPRVHEDNLVLERKPLNHHY